MTGSTLLFGSGREIAERLRREVREELGVTISVGVSFNKVFAKLGSDLKKPDAVSEIPPDRFREIVWGLSAREMIGVGDSTARRLESMGVYTIGQLARFDRKLLGKKLGKHGDALWQCANGEDRSPVALENAEEEVKSVGNSVTCPRDLQTAGEVWSVLLLVAESVSRRLREKQLCAGLVTVTIKDNRFSYTEHSRRLEYSCRDSTDLARAAMEAFQERYRWDRPVRAVGLRATELTDEGEAAQISLYSGFSEGLPPGGSGEPGGSAAAEVRQGDHPAGGASGGGAAQPSVPRQRSRPDAHLPQPVEECSPVRTALQKRPGYCKMEG